MGLNNETITDQVVGPNLIIIINGRTRVHACMPASIIAWPSFHWGTCTGPLTTQHVRHVDMSGGQVSVYFILFHFCYKIYSWWTFILFYFNFKIKIIFLFLFLRKKKKGKGKTNCVSGVVDVNVPPTLGPSFSSYVFLWK